MGVSIVSSTPSDEGTYVLVGWVAEFAATRGAEVIGGLTSVDGVAGLRTNVTSAASTA